MNITGHPSASQGDPPPMSFDRFAIGDVAMFDRSFTQEEFSVFSALSGDKNPLHHDAAHAAGTHFGEPIVPLHMTLAPLSRVAGMIFPGKPSLYLGHEVRAAKPVYYGQKLRYTARIAGKNEAHRILTLRVLAVCGADVVLDTMMRVQATEGEWDTVPAADIIHTTGPAQALVTGASGGIGSAVALALGAAGWSLILQVRGEDVRRRDLAAALERNSVPHRFITADLATPEGRGGVAEALGGLEDVEAVVHTASAGASAPLDQLVGTNYEALRAISEAVLPAMLSRQKGRLIYVSSAMIRGVPGWDDYVAAKTMATGYLEGLEKRLAPYGVRGLSILPGIVDTPFSQPVKGSMTASQASRGHALALLPQEVAEVIVEMVHEPSSSAVLMEVGRRQRGSFGLHFASGPSSQKSADNNVTADETKSNARNTDTEISEDTIAELVRRKLRLPAGTDLSQGGLGITPGWDSLSQIELILSLEDAFNISFSSGEIEALSQFSSLVQSVIRKLK